MPSVEELIFAEAFAIKSGKDMFKIAYVQGRDQPRLRYQRVHCFVGKGEIDVSGEIGRKYFLYILNIKRKHLSKLKCNRCDCISLMIWCQYIAFP